MKKRLAFVLSGGGARGALQVGALRALLEAGIHPDLLVGTSVGAVNSAFMALNGVSLASVEKLVDAWVELAMTDLFPANYLWLTVRTLFGRPAGYYSNRMQNFFLTHGLTPDVRFSDVQGVNLYIVAADLNAGQAIVYGHDPGEPVLEAVLASTALPPWVSPMSKDGRLIIDGGAVSTLPVEPAISVGATEIIALDLADRRGLPKEENGFGPFVTRLLNIVGQRQSDLELALAEARGVPVLNINLLGPHPVELWDFRHTSELFSYGYEITQQAIPGWLRERTPWWEKLLKPFK